jgi:uracil-DNA glycosylase
MSGREHPVLRLFEQLRHFGSYPAGVRGIDETQRVRGTAFFPAGNGLWDSDGSMPALPDRPLMILGHNFGDPTAMEDALKRGTEDLSGATWRNLRGLLAEAKVTERRCFFTNSLMGLKDDGKGCVGPMSNDPAYRKRCTDFLRFQIDVIRPGCVLALGDEAKDAIFRLSVEVKAAWCGPRGGSRSIKSLLEQIDLNPTLSVRLSGSFSCPVAIVYHPSELRNLRPMWTEAVAVVRAAASLCGD